jgi:hypothetical protein
VCLAAHFLLTGFASLRPALRVVLVVALLAERAEVQEVGGFGLVVVDMSCRQDYFASSDGVGFSVLGCAPFTEALGSDESDEVASELPVRWVSVSVFWEDWHGFFLFEPLPKSN